MSNEQLINAGQITACLNLHPITFLADFSAAEPPAGLTAAEEEGNKGRKTGKLLPPQQAFCFHGTFGAFWGQKNNRTTAMRRLIIFLCFNLWAMHMPAQTCSNPGARLARLRAACFSKDTVYQWIKNDLGFIRPQAGDTIADIGSYDGYYPLLYSVFSDSAVFYLNDITRDGFVYFDSIQAVCATLKGRALSNTFTIVIGQDSSTNLQDHLFDKVVVRDALHHFKSMDTMLADIKRIMKPGARLILFEPIRGRNINTNTLCKGVMTVEQLYSLLNKNGFTLTRELAQTVGGSWFEFKRTNE